MILRIKEILKEKNITVVALSKAIGITQPNTSNIVNGKTTPSLETLERIANALCIPITELFEKPNKEYASITCPHCGKDINLKIE